MRQFVITVSRREFRCSTVNCSCPPFCNDRETSKCSQRTRQGPTNWRETCYFRMGNGTETQKGNYLIKFVNIITK